MGAVQDRRDLDILETDIEEFLADNSGLENTLARGRWFCRWCLDALFDMPIGSVEKHILDGTGDNSIDAAFDYHGTLIVIQAKYKNSHSYKEIHSFNAEVARIKDGTWVGTRLDVRDVIQQISYYRSVGRPVRFMYITNAVFTSADRERTSAARSAVDMDFLDLHGILELLKERQFNIPKSVEGKEFELAASSALAVMRHGNCTVAAVPLGEIARLITELGPGLFAQNVRAFLKSTRVNRLIRDTLKSRPQQFFSYNNGITMVCTRVKRVPNSGIMTITSPQIVNGCQTAYTIYEFARNKGSRELGGTVLVRILEEADHEELQRITLFTNSQNPVKRSNFLALEGRVKGLQQKARKYGVYLEAQKGAFALLGDTDRLKYQGQAWMDYLLVPSKKGLRIQVQTALQAYTAAFLGDPATAFGNAQGLMPDGSNPWEILDDAPPEVEYFLFPTLVYQYAEKSLEYGSQAVKAYKRSGRWFYVFVFFRLLWTWCAINSLTLRDSSQDPRQIPPEILKRLFKNQALNEQFLRAADALIRSYFEEDTLIITRVAGNYSWFFKSGFKTLAEKDRYNIPHTPLEIVDIKIRRYLEGLPTAAALAEIAAAKQHR